MQGKILHVPHFFAVLKCRSRAPNTRGLVGKYEHDFAHVLSQTVRPSD